MNIALKVQKRIKQLVAIEMGIENLGEKLKKYKAKFAQAQRFILQTLTRANQKSKAMSQCKIYKVTV